MFGQQNQYEGYLKETFDEFPKTENLFSIDPEKRGTASSALMSEYLNTKPYACDPSTLPKYPPNKETDAKYREELQRMRRATIKKQDNLVSKKTRKSRRTIKEPLPSYQPNRKRRRKPRQNSCQTTPSETSQATTRSEFPYTALSQATAPASGFAWAGAKNELQTKEKKKVGRLFLKRSTDGLNYSEDSELSKEGSTLIQEQELRTLYPLQIQQLLVVSSLIQLFQTTRQQTSVTKNKQFQLYNEMKKRINLEFKLDNIRRLHNEIKIIATGKCHDVISKTRLTIFNVISNFKTSLPNWLTISII
ncbi:Uncharacterized protein Rs2_20488 [Raphanus sativus]|nr:Uncharacterized protein Rs2_20488 [Raphanus sativus]